MTARQVSGGASAAVDIPSVTIAVPTLDEVGHIDACLDAVGEQTYSRIAEILVVDGGSTDGTQDRARTHPNVRIVPNASRVQSAALNLAMNEAAGDILVRVDARTRLAPDYVARCVRALDDSGAAMVGGAQTAVGASPIGRGIAAALASRLGAGPARFRRAGPSGWVDTVYLGAFRIEVARRAGGYDELLATNEDAEFAHRMASAGGVWFDPTISSTYVPRDDLIALGRQFFRYGRGRAASVAKDPRSLSLRQLVPPLLILGLASPRRRTIAAAYLLMVGVRSTMEARRNPAGAGGMAAAMPVMHLSWGLGFLTGLVASSSRPVPARTGR